MSLFNDYQTAINSLAEEKRHKDTIGYQNYLQSEANRQGGLKAITNTAISAALGYAFPIAGLSPGASAALGGALGFMGGGNAMALPYMFNRGGTPKPTGGDVGGSGTINPTGDFSMYDKSVSPILSTSTKDFQPLGSWTNQPISEYDYNPRMIRDMWKRNMRGRRD